MRLELRRCDGPVELREDGETPTIEGYGSVFYDAKDPGTEYELWKGAVERVMPGAFDQTIKDDDVRGLFNHDPNLILGRTEAGTMQLSADAKGLRYSIDPPRTSVGDDLAELLRRGDISGSSIGFEVTEVNWRDEEEKEIRELRSIKLWDVGPVTYPAFEATSSGIRSLKDSRKAERRLLELERDQLKAKLGYRRRVAQMACLGVDYLGRIIVRAKKDGEFET